MRRILVLFTVPILVLLGIVSASSASADTISGGALANGTSVTGNISVPDRQIEYTFAGTDGVHETLDVTASHWGADAAQLGVYLPNGVAAAFCPIDATPTFCEFTPHVTGTWKVIVQPLDDAVGGVTFKLAADQVKGALTPGIASTSTISIKGQQAGYTFTGATGVHNVIDVSATNWGAGTAALKIYQPDGVYAVNCPIESTPTTCDFTPPVSGAWKAVISPDDGAVGSATITLAADPNRGTLTPGVAVVAKIDTRATTASYTFAATKGVRDVIAVSATNWGTGTANLNIYQPDGVYAVNCPIDSTPMVCDFTPPVDGTWKAVIAPDDNAVGSATITLAADQDKGVLSPGVVSTTTIATPGQHAFYTFAAAKGDKSVIKVSATSWAGETGSAALNIYQPNGVLGVICPIFAVATTCNFNPPVTGTWKVGILPDDNAVGSATITMVADQNKGTLVTGTAVTTAVPNKGTTASYTFPATKDVHNVLDVSATSWGTGSAELKLYLPTGELGLSCPIKATALLCDFIPHVTGTWKVVIDPVGDSVGTVTMTLGADQNKGALIPGTPATTTFGSRGWQASYTFAATAKQHLTLDVTATTWVGGGANLYVYQPNGVLAVICPLAATPTFCDFTPPVTGTWKVTVAPATTATGSATMLLAADQNKGTLAVGAASTTTINIKGQRAYYAFTGTSGKDNTITVTATNWGAGGSANLNIYQPSGERVVICPISSTPTTCKFTPRVSGAWKAEIAPIGNAKGAATLTLK